jgi:hypothetical protein
MSSWDFDFRDGNLGLTPTSLGRMQSPFALSRQTNVLCELDPPSTTAIVGSLSPTTRRCENNAVSDRQLFVCVLLLLWMLSLCLGWRWFVWLIRSLRLPHRTNLHLSRRRKWSVCAFLAVSFAALALGFPIILLGWYVHCALEHCYLWFGRRFCKRLGLAVSRCRCIPGFISNVKTEYSIVEFDCADPQQGRTLVRLLVWIFGIREVLSIEPFPEKYWDSSGSQQ